jgi:hypothetical protein
VLLRLQSSCAPHSQIFLIDFRIRRNPAGELRANLMMPNGTATITYDTAAAPMPSTFNPFGPQLSVSASISITVTGLTGSVTAAHLHGPAFFGSTGGVLVSLCNPCTSAGSSGYTQTFLNVSIPTALLSNTASYINVHTAANPNGEARGQLATVVFPTTAAGVNVGDAALNVLQGTTARTFSFTANSLQNVGANTQSQATANFSLTFNPANSSFTISNIVVQNLQSPLTAMHIHGPCLGAPCNADVVYMICGPGGNPCPSATSATVNMLTVTAADAGTFGLYQNITSGMGLYYVNISTIK